MRRPLRLLPLSSPVALAALIAVLLGLADVGGIMVAQYRIDRAGAMLSHPVADPSSADALQRMRHALGYDGFLAQAASYLAAKDSSLLDAMRHDVESTDGVLRGWPAADPEVKTLAAIVGLYDTALGKLTDGTASDADLMPLYAAQPALDAIGRRLPVTSPAAAQADLNLWTAILAACGWTGLALSVLCACALAAAMRRRGSLPMRAMVQSIQNMVRGDMRTAIWGIERQDQVGDLARAVDAARYHFSQLPDLSLISEQGPVRLRFEGATRSLFDAMMQAIASDAEAIRGHATRMADSAQGQQGRIDEAAARLEQAIHSVVLRGQESDMLLRTAVQTMANSAGTLGSAHAQATIQLNQLIPDIRERATGLLEIARVTGQQSAQSLLVLRHNDTELREGAARAKDILDRLSATADDLGERLFGAINLLQASGRILAETAQAARTGQVPHGVSAASVDLSPIIGALEQTRASIAARLDSLPDRVLAVTDLSAFSAPAMPEGPSAEEIAAAVDKRLDPRWAALAALPTPLTTALPDTRFATLQDGVQTSLRALGDKVDHAVAAMHAFPAGQASRWDALARQIDGVKQGLDDALKTQLGQQADAMALKLNAACVLVETTVTALRTEWRAAQGQGTPGTDVRDMIRDQWYQIAAQIEATRGNIAGDIATQIERLETRLRAARDGAPAEAARLQIQIAQQIDILSDMAGMLGALNTHMRDMRDEIPLPRSA